MRLKQHTMIDVEVANGEKPTCIFERLFNVYDKATVGMIPVRGRVRRIKEAIARVIPQSLQLQRQVTFASLGLCHKSGECRQHRGGCITPQAVTHSLVP